MDYSAFPDFNRGVGSGGGLSDYGPPPQAFGGLTPWPILAPEWAKCQYKCPPVAPSVNSHGFCWCHYFCILQSANPGATCPPTTNFWEACVNGACNGGFKVQVMDERAKSEDSAKSIQQEFNEASLETGYLAVALAGLAFQDAQAQGHSRAPQLFQQQRRRRRNRALPSDVKRIVEDPDESLRLWSSG